MKITVVVVCMLMAHICDLLTIWHFCIMATLIHPLAKGVSHVFTRHGVACQELILLTPDSLFC